MAPRWGYVQATVRASEVEVQAEVAWVVGLPWQGRGLATEAARALVDTLARAGVTTVVAHIAPGYVASERVAAAAGLAPTNVVHDGEVQWRRSPTDAPADVLARARRRVAAAGTPIGLADVLAELSALRSE